jgi:uncharacterized protein
MNINGMALAYAYEDPSISGGATGSILDYHKMLLKGTMRALFSLVTYAVCSTLLDRMEKKGLVLCCRYLLF